MVQTGKNLSEQTWLFANPQQVAAATLMRGTWSSSCMYSIDIPSCMYSIDIPCPKPNPKPLP